MSNKSMQTQQTAALELARLLPPQDGELPVQYISRMMEMLPPPAEDAVNKIVASILGADTPGDENELWDAMSSKDAAGKAFRFHSVHAYPSTYEESPLRYFLVCNVTDLASGEKAVLTTGAVNVVTALVKAQVLGRLPWDAEVVAPKGVKSNGKIPLRLRWLARPAGAIDDGQ